MRSGWYRIKSREELMALPDFVREKYQGLVFRDHTFFSKYMFDLPRIIKLELCKHHEYKYRAFIKGSRGYWDFKEDWVIPITGEEARAAEILYG